MLMPITNLQFQKISIPTKWKVIGNSEGVGSLKSHNFYKESGISTLMEGFKAKTFCGGTYGYFLEQQNGINTSIRKNCIS